MARTRATKGASKAASSKEDGTAASTSKYSLPAESIDPPKILILPNKATAEARVVSLKHPRYSRPTRYLICPETGAYEFTKISAPKTTPRSWLIQGPTADDAKDENDSTHFETQVTRGADLCIATPIDPLFLSLPALAAQFSSTGKRMFLSSDDHFDTISEEQPHLRETVVKWPQWRKQLESRMAAVCDTVEAGDEVMFRLSEEKLLDQIVQKAQRISENGLPGSMESKFVAKALEAPVLGIKKTNPVAALKTEASTISESSGDSQTQSSESQSSVATTATSASEASTAAISVVDASEAQCIVDAASAIQASNEVIRLQRLRIAFNFICSCYVPPAMAAVLKKMLLERKGPDAVDFGPLDDYIAQLTKMRQEAMTARSASDYSRKRTLDEEDEDKREKRRKKEEEEKRKKAGESRGVRDLKKVNTAGMMKLSAFFKPKGS